MLFRNAQYWLFHSNTFFQEHRLGWKVENLFSPVITAGLGKARKSLLIIVARDSDLVIIIEIIGFLFFQSIFILVLTSPKVEAVFMDIVNSQSSTLKYNIFNCKIFDAVWASD